jgi:hypothetical protein
MRLRARCVALLFTAGLLAAAADVRAGEPNEGGNAAAESLFQEARKLIDAKRYSEACPKLVASHKLAPAVGTLLNLADCYERAGQLASAWARFHEAIALAQRLGRPDREKTAKERADKLEPRLIKLTIVAPEPGLEVKLDGNVLDPAVLGAPLPVDPGKHTIDATAKGKKSFNTTIDVSERTRAPSVEVPPLDVDGEPVKGGPTRPPVERPEAARSDGSTQRLVGVLVMGGGVAGAAVGSFFGLRTSSKWSDAKAHCTGLECDRTGVQLATDAKNAGTISTIAFIAGGALLAGGAVLYFTAPSAPPKSAVSGATRANASASDVRLGVGLGSIVVGGTF